MSPTKEQLLYAQFPALFKERTLPITQSLMCWGICCGDGWFELLQELCLSVEQAIDSGEMPPASFSQIKEKLGSLRVHYTGGNDSTRLLIEVFRDRSTTICEECGASGSTCPIHHE